jgi:tripeptidyl-peptidase-1
LPHAASRFEKLYRADALDAHQVVVAVRQNGMDELQSILMDISHPDSPNFGNFLTDAEIAAYTACEASGRLVVDYLTSRGATVHNVARNWEYITASWTIGGWEDALSTEFYAFDTGGSPRILRALEYSTSCFV